MKTQQISPETNARSGRGWRLLRTWVALSSCWLLVGCSSLSTRTIQYVGVTRYAPTDPARVELLREVPTRPHDRLGEVVVDTSIDPAPPIAKIESAIRTRAAQMGAEAAVVVYDKLNTTGMVVTGHYWTSSVSPINERVIVAVAIRYR